MKSSILLISANVFRDPYPIYPIGVSYLKTSLERALPEGCRVDTYDMNFGSLDDLSDRLKNGHYDYVGLSMRNIDDNNLFADNSFVVWYRQIADTIRKSADVILIGGGSGYSIFPDILLSELGLNYGVKGEGENSLLLLMQRLADGQPTDDIQGLVFRRSDGSVQVNPRTAFEEAPSLRFDDEWMEYYWERSGMLNIQTKRGCPHRCIYCSYPVIEGRKVRTLSPEEVVATLKDIYFNKNITYVFFTDSLFNIHKEYNRKLCRLIMDSGVKINWGAYFAPRELSEEELRLYKQAGLTHIEFGTDSFADSQLLNYCKGFTWKDVQRSSAICDDLGIFYAHFMILAGYGETEESLEETFEHSKQLTNTVIFPYIGMRLYPHTRLFDIARTEGKIKDAADLLNPYFYVSDAVNIHTIKERAVQTGAKWIFPDDDSEDMMARFRAKKRRGPLWEYLRY
jgi:radical SAM superfamily enzyme YgiQ (UPF0313 family)